MTNCKKQLLSFIFIFITVISFAQDKDSPAYRTGYALGRIVGVVLIAGFVIWGISKLFRKK
jgi:hypothetical protein